MKSFDETYADQDFKEQIAAAQSGWMAQVPHPGQPDLNVEGLRGSFLVRLFCALTGRRN